MKVQLFLGAFAAAMLLSGCYTGEIPLEHRFIQDAKIRLVQENGNDYLRFTGRCGLPRLAVVETNRRLENGVIRMDIVLKEATRGDSCIDEQFLLPEYVDKVMLGKTVIWQRPVTRRRGEW